MSRCRARAAPRERRAPTLTQTLVTRLFRRCSSVCRAARARADKKVFPKFDVVGWYSTGAELQEADLELQRTVRVTRGRGAPGAVCGACSLTRGLPVRAQMTAITESPVFVLFNPAVRSAVSKDLPITLYESGAFFCGALLVCVPTAGKLKRSPA